MLRTMVVTGALAFAGAVSGQELVGAANPLNEEQNRAFFAALNGKLVDPYSVKITDAKVDASLGPVLLCGMLNAKNRMGAYTGAIPFAFNRGSGDLTILGRDDEETLRQLKQYAMGPCPKQ
ncbi:hypothetical protein [Tianweitania sediminis]|uniref:Uncharacterized protein n=1 Tax=Tianweitania sediminis TaxID=1502156 RepID=A0A8J7RQ05_9HYPH|nr:hypothetical protein [Tianweitania sediminis]MBP0439914.1 hypothetical protein [Tianweitania sediminis]